MFWGWTALWRTEHQEASTYGSYICPEIDIQWPRRDPNCTCLVLLIVASKQTEQTYPLLTEYMWTTHTQRQAYVKLTLDVVISVFITLLNNFPLKEYCILEKLRLDLEIYRRFGRTCCFNFQGRRFILSFYPENGSSMFLHIMLVYTRLHGVTSHKATFLQLQLWGFQFLRDFYYCVYFGKTFGRFWPK